MQAYERLVRELAGECGILDEHPRGAIHAVLVLLHQTRERRFIAARRTSNEISLRIQVSAPRSQFLAGLKAYTTYEVFPAPGQTAQWLDAPEGESILPRTGPQSGRRTTDDGQR